MNTTDLSNPLKFGPGTWYVIHTIAKNATNEEKKYHFVTVMESIKNTLPCEKCRNHCLDYIKNNPIEAFWNVTNDGGEQIGLFKWSWIFHNAVNKRLNKPLIDWDTAYNMYGEPGTMICTKGCEDKTIETVNKNMGITFKPTSGLSVIRAVNDSQNLLKFVPSYLP